MAPLEGIPINGEWKRREDQSASAHLKT